MRINSHGALAGIIAEPITNGSGARVFPPGYLRGLREMADRNNIPLIFDEHATGLGRTGRLFACEYEGVTPDVMVIGKSLGGGCYAISAVLSQREVLGLFTPGSHGSTFGANPLACAAGIAVIDELIEKDLCNKAICLGDYLAAKLEELKKYGVIREVRGKGVLRGVEFVKDTKTMQPFPELGKALKQTALKNGLIMRIDPNWFAVCPPLIAEESDIDEMCERIDKSLHEALQVVDR